jgi:hypothetical protein
MSDGAASGVARGKAGLNKKTDPQQRQESVQSKASRGERRPKTLPIGLRLPDAPPGSSLSGYRACYLEREIEYLRGSLGIAAEIAALAEALDRRAFAALRGRPFKPRMLQNYLHLGRIPKSEWEYLFAWRDACGCPLNVRVLIQLATFPRHRRLALDLLALNHVTEENAKACVRAVAKARATVLPISL